MLLSIAIKYFQFRLFFGELACYNKKQLYFIESGEIFMKKLFLIFISLMLMISMVGCGDTGQTNSVEQQNESGTDNDSVSATTAQEDSPSDEKFEESEDITNMKMNVQIGDVSFTAVLEDNAATSELIEMMRQAPISIDMSDYSGFEKVGSLGKSLTTDNHQTTTSAGDIVLYNGNQIVMFYGSNSWSYTRIGRIEDLSGWEEALGSGSITVTFTVSE